MAETKINTKQINLGDESVIDLVVSQNKAKTELANNLQGLGISANASTDTLEELAYKVSTVSADTDRQKPKAIAISTDYFYEINNGLADGYIIKNGWFFWIYNDSSNLKLRRFKLSAMSVTNYNTVKTISQASTNVGSLSNGSYVQFMFNDDGSNLYVMNNNSIKKYPISGYDTSTITVGSVTTYTPKFDYGSGYENIDLFRFDVNSTETQLIVTDRSGNVGIYDLTSSGDQNISIIGTERFSLFFANNTNNNLIELWMHEDSGRLDINMFNIVSGQLNLLSTTYYQCGNKDNWHRGIIKYKDTNNSYKLIMNLGNVNSDTDPTFLLIDCATLAINSIFSKLNYTKESNYSNDAYIDTPTITIINNNYYLLAGFWLAVFDSNWNLIGNIINRFNIEGTSYYYHQVMLYGNIIYLLGQSDTTIYVVKLQTWMNKLVAYERTVNKIINGETVETLIPYFPLLNANDLDAGYYDN